MHENMSAASGCASAGKSAVARARASFVPARMSSVFAVVSWTVAPTGTEPNRDTDPVVGSDPTIALRYDPSVPTSATARGFPNEAGPVRSR